MRTNTMIVRETRQGPQHQEQQQKLATANSVVVPFVASASNAKQPPRLRKDDNFAHAARKLTIKSVTGISYLVAQDCFQLFHTYHPISMLTKFFFPSLPRN